MLGRQQGVLGRGQRFLTYSQLGRAGLRLLAIVVIQLEGVRRPPVGQQRAVGAERHRLAAVDAAEPHGVK